MCGIAALFRTSGFTVPDDVVDRMTDTVAHRGPDGRGTRFLGGAVASERPFAAWKAALGHRRLSILDLSEAGAQPMRRGDVWITYNGEVYNFVELRAELEALGHTFRSHTDTEVILAAWEAWGHDAFARLRGMWGLVLVDRARKIAVLSRDRLGIKPLYVARGPGWVGIASEIKQLAAIPGFRLVARDGAVGRYLATGYEEAEGTFFEGVTPLPAGTTVDLDLASLEAAEPRPYWFPERVAADVRDPAEAARRFDAAFAESVRIHLRSDVPVGCALSGGLDSSAIAVEIGRADPAVRLDAFSVVFPGHANDESRYVDAVVARTGARLHTVTPSPTDLVAGFDDFVWHHDEPVGSAAQFAGYALARLTRAEAVPVTLNGQGGDEIFAGYWQSYFAHLRALVPGHAPRLARHLLGAASPAGNRELLRQIPVMWRRYRSRTGAAGPIVKLRGEPGPAPSAVKTLLGLGDQERRLFEIRSFYLPRLLKWDDRNFMAAAVEGRYPFLDHAVIETALSFAPEALYRRGWVKEPLRRAFADRLPREVLQRRTKMGFETPQTEWMRGALRTPVQLWLRGDSPAWRWVDRADAQALADRVWSGPPDEERAQALFRLWNVDRWARRFALGAPTG